MRRIGRMALLSSNYSHGRQRSLLLSMATHQGILQLSLKAVLYKGSTSLDPKVGNETENLLQIGPFFSVIF